MKVRMKIIWGLGLFLIFSLIFAEEKRIKVGFYENPPKLFTNDYGEISGFFPAILSEIAEKENWNTTKAIGLHY
ncbi:MAG: hypothetical protein PHR06_00705 [Candidatus Cloacimonetes bacterium]|nr:hypothetical protein [Candidatus Cloacimonadota bacterium]